MKNNVVATCEGPEHFNSNYNNRSKRQSLECVMKLHWHHNNAYWNSQINRMATLVTVYVNLSQIRPVHWWTYKIIFFLSCCQLGSPTPFAPLLSNITCMIHICKNKQTNKHLIDVEINTFWTKYDQCHSSKEFSEKNKQTNMCIYIQMYWLRVW